MDAIIDSWYCTWNDFNVAMLASRLPPGLRHPTMRMAVVHGIRLMEASTARACVTACELQTFLSIEPELYRFLVEASDKVGFENSADYLLTRGEELDINAHGSNSPLFLFLH